MVWAVRAAAFAVVGVMLAVVVVVLESSSVVPEHDQWPAEMPATLVELHGPWQAIPLLAHPELLASADRACRKDIPFPADLHLALVDLRGAGVLEAFYAGPLGEMAHCAQMSITAAGTVEAGGGGSHSSPSRDVVRPLEPTELLVLSMHGGGGRADWDWAEMEHAGVFGRAGAAIRQITVMPAGHPPMAASVANGWFAAWWPGPTRGRVLAIIGHDADGNQVAELVP